MTSGYVVGGFLAGLVIMYATGLVMDERAERNGNGAMASGELSEAIQDYLKEIYKLEESDDHPGATTTAIAKAMGVAPSSTTAMLKKLAALGLVEHTRYHGRADRGRRAGGARGDPPSLLARAVPRRDARGCPSTVHQEADRLEHALSEELNR